MQTLRSFESTFGIFMAVGVSRGVTPVTRGSSLMGHWLKSKYIQRSEVEYERNTYSYVATLLLLGESHVVVYVTERQIFVLQCEISAKQYFETKRTVHGTVCWSFVVMVPMETYGYGNGCSAYSPQCSVPLFCDTSVVRYQTTKSQYAKSSFRSK